MESYKDLLALLRETGRWGILEGCTNLHGPGRAQYLRNVIACAGDAHDDAHAKEVLPLYWQAVRDVAFESLLVRNEESAGYHLLDTVEATKLIDQAEDDWNSECADLATKLYTKLPAVQRVPYRCGYKEMTDAPTLIETKAELMRVIGKRWAVTKDDTEAEKLFAFLGYIKFPHPKECSVAENALREVIACISLTRASSALRYLTTVKAASFLSSLILHKTLKSASGEEFFRTILSAALPFVSMTDRLGNWDNFGIKQALFQSAEDYFSFAPSFATLVWKLCKCLQPDSFHHDPNVSVVGSIFVKIDPIDKQVTIKIVHSDTASGASKLHYADLAKAKELASKWLKENKEERSILGEVNLELWIKHEWSTFGQLNPSFLDREVVS